MNNPEVPILIEFPVDLYMNSIFFYPHFARVTMYSTVCITLKSVPYLFFADCVYTFPRGLLKLCAPARLKLSFFFRNKKS